MPIALHKRWTLSETVERVKEMYHDDLKAGLEKERGHPYWISWGSSFGRV